MSENLQRNKDFVKLLITTTQTQVKALLSTVTPAQVQCLVEIAYNLLTLKKFRHKQKKLLEIISKSSVSKTRKQSVIVKYNRILLNILKEFSYIFEAL